MFSQTLPTFSILFGTIFLATEGSRIRICPIRHADLQNDLAYRVSYFTFRFFKVVSERNSGRSVGMSPFSAEEPLAALMLGSSGATHDQLLYQLHLLNNAYTRHAFKSINDRLRRTKGIAISMPNRMFIMSAGWSLQPSFFSDMRRYFRMSGQEVNFQDPVGAASSINSWIKRRTHNSITNVISPEAIDASIRMLIVSSLYLQGRWDCAIDVRQTQPQQFYGGRAAHAGQLVPTMRVSGTFLYCDCDDLDAELLSLPYFGGDVSMLIVLPKNTSALPSVINNLAQGGLPAESMTPTNVDAYIPKLSIKTSIDLVDTFLKMGITEIFNPVYSGLTGLVTRWQNLYVNKVIQKTSFKIDERGSEITSAFASGNASSIVLTSQAPVTFRANRPFVIIVKTYDNLPLYIAQYYGPNTAVMAQTYQ